MCCSRILNILFAASAESVATLAVPKMSLGGVGAMMLRMNWDSNLGSCSLERRVYDDMRNIILIDSFKNELESIYLN